MDMQTIDFSQPRRRYFSDDCGLDICPECGKQLSGADCSILVEARTDTDMRNFITSMSGAHFCEVCPVVVFDIEAVNRAAMSAFDGARKVVYVIAGIVDMSAIPGDKMGVPVGSDGNPVPLVRFLPEIRKPKPVASALKAPDRNAPCMCGRGQKYKKCCGKG